MQATVVCLTLLLASSSMVAGRGEVLQQQRRRELAIPAGELPEPEEASAWASLFSASKQFAEYYHDFEALVRLQAHPEDKWVSLMMHTVGMRAMNLNCIYSMVKYGKVENIVIGVLHDDDLEDCASYHLPCVSLRPLLEEVWPQRTLPMANDDMNLFNFGTLHHHTIGWAKFFMVQKVLQMGYTAHVTDGDISYFRPVRESYELQYAKTGADVIAMSVIGEPGLDDWNTDGWKERVINLVNVGNMLLRSNERTLKLMETWLDLRGMGFDQPMFNSIAYKHWAFCESRGMCFMAAGAGMVSLARTPSHRGERSFHSCLVESWDYIPGGPCSPHLLYFHVLCIVGLEAKHQAYDNLNLWVINSTTMEPLTEPHVFLPCPNGPAWDDWPYLGG